MNGKGLTTRLLAALAVSALLTACASKPAPRLFEGVKPPSRVTQQALKDAVRERRAVISVGLCGAERASVIESNVLRRLTVNAQQDDALLMTLRGEVFLSLAPEYERQFGNGDGALDRAEELFHAARRELPDFVPASLGLARTSRLRGEHEQAVDWLGESTSILLDLASLIPTKGELPPRRGLLELLGVLRRIEEPTGNAARFEQLTSWFAAYDRWTDMSLLPTTQDLAEQGMANAGQVFQRMYAAITTELALLAGAFGDIDTASQAFDLAYSTDPDYLPGRLVWADWALANGNAGEVAREFVGWASLAEQDANLAYAGEVLLIAAEADATMYRLTGESAYRERAIRHAAQLLQRGNRNGRALLTYARIHAADPSPDLDLLHRAIQDLRSLPGCVREADIEELEARVAARSGRS